MHLNDQKKFSYVLYHVLFWVVYCLFMATLIGLNGNQPFLFIFTHYLTGIPAFALFAYPMLNLLVPVLVTRERNLFTLSILLITASVLAAALKLVLNHLVFYGFFWPSSLEPDRWFSLSLLFQNLLPVWIPAMFLAVHKYTREWLKETRAKAELEKENLETELKMLKNQLNPHFLFNTLNNLYSLALMKSDKTPEMISRLSDMFQFILYECNAPWITLKKEMNLINNYVQLQQLRYGNRLDFSIQTDVNIESFRLAPMILFTFVENCFKHGSGGDPGIPWIKLSLGMDKDRLHFAAENSKPHNNNSQENGKSGIGLGNLQKRLDLLYPNHYTLTIINEPRVYKVDLLLDEIAIP